MDVYLPIRALSDDTLLAVLAYDAGEFFLIQHRQWRLPDTIRQHFETKHQLMTFGVIPWDDEFLDILRWMFCEPEESTMVGKFYINYDAPIHNSDVDVLRETDACPFITNSPTSQYRKIWDTLKYYARFIKS